MYKNNLWVSLKQTGGLWVSVLSWKVIGVINFKNCLSRTKQNTDYGISLYTFIFWFLSLVFWVDCFLVFSLFFFPLFTSSLLAFILIPMEIPLVNRGTFPHPLGGKSNLYSASSPPVLMFTLVPRSCLSYTLGSDMWCQVSESPPSSPMHNGHLQKDLAIWPRPSGLYHKLNPGESAESLMKRSGVTLLWKRVIGDLNNLQRKFNIGHSIKQTHTVHHPL